MTPPERSLSFDPARLAALLDGEQKPVRERVREILSRLEFRYLPVTASIELQREQAFRWCQLLADEGVGLLAVPKRYGGQGDFPAFMAAFETIAFHDLGMTIKFTVQFGSWLGSVLLLGNERQHASLLHRIGTFELPGCFAMTEIGHGSNVRELETTAVYDAATQEFIVNSPTWTAGKNYIGNGACHGRLATTFAQLEVDGKPRGVHALLVPLRDEGGNVLPGVRIEDNGPKMGENGVDNARVWFENVRVTRGALLDRFGRVTAEGVYESDIRSDGARFFATISALVGGRISIALAGLSAAKSGLAIAVRYATRRRQFRAPGAERESALMDYQTHQRRLMPLLANAYAADLLLKDLVRRRAETLEGEVPEADRRELELLAGAAKAWTTWNTTRTLQTCRECCGGEGYMSVNRLPALKADADIFTTFEGDNTVLMVWVGRQLLAGRIKEERSGEDALDAEKQSVAENVREVFGSKKPSADGVVDYRELFRRRERGILDHLWARLQTLTKEEGRTEHEATARLQNLLLLAAGAYVERVMLEVFARTVAAQPDEGGERAILQKLYGLFAASLLEGHRGWFLEHGIISAGLSQAVPSVVEAACGELAGEAEALVEAFGIPAQCLAAPIAGV